MNYVDLFLGIIILMSALSGAGQGFVSAMLDLIGWVASLIFTFWLYPYVAVFFEKYVADESAWTILLSFLITLVFLRLLVNALIYRIVRSIPRETHQHGVNKALGIIPGSINGIIWAAILAAIMLTIPLWNGLAREARGSAIASRLTGHVERLENFISPELDTAIKRSLTRLTVEPGSTKMVELPYTTSNYETRNDLEREMLEMINKERAERNLPLLKFDPELAAVARKHSADMFEKGYFSHISKTGTDPFDRIRAAGVPFLTAGENLALAPTLPIAHEGLMNSPGHKANILNPAYGRVGIGILDGGIHGLMVTQNFKN